MIRINFTGIENSFGSFSLMTFNFGITQKASQRSKMTAQELDSGKHIVISSYLNFCILPDFDIPNDSMDPLLVDSFYNVAIKLTKDFNFTDSQFTYFKSNLLAKEACDKFELIKYLATEWVHTWLR